MGEHGEKSLRFVVCAVQERYTRAGVLFVFFKTKVLFVILVEKEGVVVSQCAKPNR